MVLGQLRHRVSRSLALLAAIALATTSFSVLTGAAETSRLQVRGMVDANFRSSYDLLVRPTSSYTALEQDQALVRPNYQSGIFGGITLDQLAQLRGVQGVDVAAPVANLGYVAMSSSVSVPIAPYLSSARQQLFRVRPVWTTDRGTSRFSGVSSYVYVSRNKTTVLKHVAYTRGDEFDRQHPAYAEVVPGVAKPVPVCTNYAVDQTATTAERKSPPRAFSYDDPFSTAARVDCYYTSSNPEISIDGPSGASDTSYLETSITTSLPVLLAAVDPVAEAQLSGLDQAVTSGRYLAATETVRTDTFGNPNIPLLAASSTDLDLQVAATVERVTATPGKHLSDVFTGERGLVQKVGSLPGTKVDTIGPVGADQMYADGLDHASKEQYGAVIDSYWTVGASSYRPTASGLAVQPVTNPATTYQPGSFVDLAPVGSDDRAVRPVTPHPSKLNVDHHPGLQVVGQYDPTRVTARATLSGVSAETYVSPLLGGADPASVAALHGQPLAPNSNVGGYAAQAPALLASLDAIGPLLDSSYFQGVFTDAPISVVRVRVAGVTGTDAVSRERLNQAALAIAQRTGLAVDIVAGASGVPTTVILPPGEHGRPELRLREDWARKGVAYEVIDAVDRKSLVLFGLILTVCLVVVANAASAAVRTRRSELGVLRCAGWGTGRLFALVVGELALLGLAAGVLGSVVAVPVARLAGLPAPGNRAIWAIPAAVVVASLAGVVPAVRASRATPLDAVRPLVRSPRRVRPVRSLAGLATRSLTRQPGRAGLAAAALGLGVAAGTILLSVQQVFRGQVVGSLLGDAVSVQVRSADVWALVAILLLGAAGVADVLYLSVREQASELAVLRATGWSDRALAQLVLSQGLLLGLLGGLVGAGVGLAGVTSLTRTVDLRFVLPAALACLGAVTVAVVASLLPAIVAGRVPVAVLAAEET